MPLAEGFGHRSRNLGFGFDDPSPHLLLGRHGHRTALLGPRLRNLLVRICLRDLELGADVLPDVHVGDVNRQNLVCRAGVKSLGEHVLRNVIRVLEDVLVRLRGSDGAHHPLADARDDGLLAGAPDQAIEVRYGP